MKNVFKGFILLLTLACFSCQDEADINNTVEKTAIADGDLAIIKSLGFDETSVVDKGDYYLVEEDVMILKENLEGYENLLSQSDTLQLRQAYVNNKVAFTKAMNITVGSVVDGIPKYGRALQKALDAYNSTGTLLSMSKSPYNGNFVTGDIQITSKTLGNGAYAESSFPSANGSVGSKIELDLITCESLSEAQLVFLFAHELGHCLGFRHTNWQQDNEKISPDGANQVPGTPTGTSSDKDNTSVFNSGNFYGAPPVWNGFSNYDMIALRYLFAPNMGASVLFVGVGETVAFSIPATLPPVTWEAVSNAVLVDGQETRTATFKATGNGYMKVKATKSLGNGRYYVVENSQPWAGKPAIPTSISGFSNTFNSNSRYIFSIDKAADGATNYRWEVSGGKIIGLSNAYGITVETDVAIGTKPKYLDIKVYAVNKYGESTYLYKTGVIKPADDGGSVIL